MILSNIYFGSLICGFKGLICGRRKLDYNEFSLGIKIFNTLFLMNSLSVLHLRFVN